MNTNDRTVYDSEGQIVCRPLVALGVEGSSDGRPTLPGVQAALVFFAPVEDHGGVFCEEEEEGG